MKAESNDGDANVEPSDEELAELEALYASFVDADLMPLWTQRAGLMPAQPAPRTQAHLWRWSVLSEIAARAGDLVKVGRGGERRAIALANPGLAGEPSITPNLWAAVQYLAPGETAPSHRHSQTAFRFVIEGEGVWTNVNGDAVAMRQGDLLLTPSWHWHEHHNPSSNPMLWLDGLDIPLVDRAEAGFFEFGPDTLSTTSTPAVSINEELWAHPGLRPLGQPAPVSSPLLAFRWENTDRSLQAQLDLQARGHPSALNEGHAAVRFMNPATGGDALTTIRLEMHRLRPGSQRLASQVVGATVWQVLSGAGEAQIADTVFELKRGDIFVVPSWAPFTLRADEALDAFCFGDAPVYERLGLQQQQR